MENSEYYMSRVMDPYNQQDDTITQIDLSERADFQYKMDSISKTIGTPECYQNINLFLDELFDEMEYETLANFWNLCVSKLVEEYHLFILEQYLIHRYFENDMIKNLKMLLNFFEKKEWVEYLSEVIPISDVNTYRVGFKEYLDMYYDQIINNIKKNNNKSKYIQYFLIMAAKEDFVYAISKLVSSDSNLIMATVLIKRGV